MTTLDQINPLELYTPRQIAGLLKVSERTVQKYIQVGRLRSAKGVGICRVLGSDVLAFLGLSEQDMVRISETKPERNARVKRARERLVKQGVLPTADVGGGK